MLPSLSAYFVHCKSISVSVNDSESITVVSTLTTPFKLSSRAFFDRILEIDKAENWFSPSVERFGMFFTDSGFAIGILGWRIFPIGSSVFSIVELSFFKLWLSAIE